MLKVKPPQQKRREFYQVKKEVYVCACPVEGRASRTKKMKLPGEVIEVMDSAREMTESAKSPTLLQDDEVAAKNNTFLKLAHAEGWVLYEETQEINDQGDVVAETNLIHLKGQMPVEEYNVNGGMLYFRVLVAVDVRTGIHYKMRFLFFWIWIKQLHPL